MNVSHSKIKDTYISSRLNPTVYSSSFCKTPCEVITSGKKLPSGHYAAYSEVAGMCYTTRCRLAYATLHGGCDSTKCALKVADQKVLGRMTSSVIDVCLRSCFL